jgi:hypothetical protein
MQVEPMAALHAILEIISAQVHAMLVLAAAPHVSTVQLHARPASLNFLWRQIVIAILTAHFHSLFLNLAEKHIVILLVQELIMPCGMAAVAQIAYLN